MLYKSGRAGKSTREMANKRRQSALGIFLIGIMVILVLWFLLQNSNILGIGGISIFILLILLRIVPDIFEGRVNRKLKEEKRAIRGAIAEEKIGELLADLTDDYYVLNDIESPYGNIDHIVISKNNGVFLIETKAHGGKVEVEGETLLLNGKLPEKDFISQTLQNTYWLRDQIGYSVGSKPWITPILVFSNAFVPHAPPLKGVRIVNKKYLLNVILETNKPNTITTKVWAQRGVIENRLI